MIDEGPDVMRLELQELPRNGDGWTVGPPRLLNNPTPEVVWTPPPPPINPWAGPLTDRPKRRWFRRNRKDRT